MSDDETCGRDHRVYDYQDAGGELLYQVVRFEPKAFRQRRPDGRGGWIWNLDGVDRVLYRLPELLTAAPDVPVFVAEGEKDVDRLLNLGLLATTNSGGAGKWRTEYAAALRGRQVVILPDNDEPGRAHAQEVVASLQGIAASVKVVELPNLPPKGDVSDWIASGGTREQLLAIVAATPKSELPTIGRSVGTELLEVAGDELVAAGLAGPQNLPSLPLLGESGYMIEKWSHLLAGYPRSGKTELVTRLTQEWLSSRYTVLYLTEEPKSIWEHRLSQLAGEWGYLRVVFGLGADPELLFKRAFEGPEQIVIVDTLRNLLRLEDETNNSEVARILNPWVAQARRREKTLLMAHHMRKGAGAHGEGIAGGHALLGVFDVALELIRDDNHPCRRLIRSYARLIAPPDLAYERSEGGQYRALGDPAALRFAEVQGRVLECVDPQEWRSTKDLWQNLGDPRPSEEQVRQVLLALAEGGKIDRDPPVGQNARGKTHRWRLQTSVPTESPIVGTPLFPAGQNSKGNGERRPGRTPLREANLPWVRRHLGYEAEDVTG